MAMKLRRSRSRSRRMFRKKSALPRLLGWILLVAFCAAAGVGVAYWSENTAGSDPSATTGSTGSTTAPSSTAPTTGTTQPPPPVVEKIAHIALETLRDDATRRAKLEALKKDGYTAVLFDLKDEDGVLHYDFSGELAKKAKAAAADALTADALTALIKDCRAAGVEPMVRLFAFKDKTATAKLKSGRINWSGDKVTLWLDAAASKGGKSWLNPYAEEAQAYITELATELQQLGIQTLVLDGVQFPEKTFEAYFGTKEQTAETRIEVLSRFVKTLNEQLGNTRLLVAANWEAVAGADSTVYGGNPLSFGADGVCPYLERADLPAEQAEAKLTAEWAQIVTRLEFIEGQKPEVLPYLAADAASLASVLPKKTPLVIEAP